MDDLQRFLTAQEHAFQDALAEISAGRKRSHWMWFIFPQLKGLGRSETATYYGISDAAEARAFLAHPVLGNRLIEITKALLQIQGKSAHDVFGAPDDLKLRSSLTLFSLLDNTDPVFQQALTKYFDGKPDQATVTLLK